MKPDKNDAEALISRVVTNVIFFWGIFVFWLGDCFIQGPAMATAIIGGIMIVAGAARWLLEE
jgi:hypothetical protein